VCGSEALGTNSKETSRKMFEPRTLWNKFLIISQGDKVEVRNLIYKEKFQYLF
jgi:hypothetical protein